MAQLVPAAGSNAIVLMAFALEFEQNLDQKLVDEIGLSRSLSAAFNGAVPRKETDISLTLRAQSGPATVKQDNLIRYVFDLPSETPGKPARMSMAISGRMIGCAFNEYTSWRQIGDEAIKLLEAALSAVPGRVLSPSSLMLQITDQFNWPAPCQPEDIRATLNHSPYVASNVFEVESLWHSHHGFFTEPTSPTWYQRQLDLVQAAVVETEAHERALTVSMVHRRAARAGVSAPIDTKSIRENFQEMKIGHNKIFKAIFSDDIQRRVGFNR